MISLPILGAAAVAGLTSSFGPCLAPRYLLVAAQLTRGATVWDLAAFLSGCISGYLTFAITGVGLSILQLGSHIVYGTLSVALIGSGLASLFSIRCTCVDVAFRPGTLSAGGRFLLGLSCSVMVSPCCAPIAVALGLQAGLSDAPMAAAILVAFGLGHAIPIGACALASSFQRIRKCMLPFGTASTISGSLLVAVGMLYAVLA